MTATAKDQDAADTIGAVGEVAALLRIFPRLPTGSQTLIGPGDDAAVLSASDGRYVMTTDMMVHGPDFRLAWSSPRDLGWKAAASNLADVAAMGAVPRALLVAMAVPADTQVGFLEAFADGLREACQALAPGCGVVGGDLSVSATLTLAVTATGDLEGRPPVLRSGARPGQVVAVSGRLGYAGAGLAALFAEGVDPDSGVPDATRADRVRASCPEVLAEQLRPTAAVAAGVTAGRAGASAMLDVSDGLLLDAGRLAQASGCGVDLDRAALTVLAAQLAGASALTPADALLAVLAGGEDHAMLAVFPTALPPGFMPIGRTVGGLAEVTLDGAALPPDVTRGWDPYRGWDRGAG